MKTLASYLAEPRTEQDDARARKLAAERAIIDLRAWWAPVREQLPRWGYARFANREWAGKVASAALDAAKAWDVLGGANLIVCGPTGAGKTSALVARMREVLAGLMGEIGDGAPLPRLPSVRWTTEEALMRDAYRWTSDDDTATWSRAQARPLVYVVDEVGFVGGERAPTGKTPALQVVVDARYAANRGTTITTGLRPGEFVERYGLAMWRRLTERAALVDLFAAGGAR